MTEARRKFVTFIMTHTEAEDDVFNDKVQAYVKVKEQIYPLAKNLIKNKDAKYQKLITNLKNEFKIYKSIASGAVQNYNDDYDYMMLVTRIMTAHEEILKETLEYKGEHENHHAGVEEESIAEEEEEE